jgi:hypothetical protein
LGFAPHAWEHSIGAIENDPVQAATIDRRHQKAQKSVKPPWRDPTLGARVLPRRREALPGVPARPPER